MQIFYADAMIDPSCWVPLAQALEAAGFDGITVPDSLCYPEVSDSKYPYTPDGNREFLEDKPFIDPFVQVAAMGAVTKRLLFTTFVIKLPIRHPVIVAKQATSLSVMTGGRFELGVGVSPWPDDYRVTGVPWKGRGKRMDECIDVIRGLSSGEFYRHEGEVFDIESIKLCPVPQVPTPIMIGGHSKAALRRAARVGDGWLHAGGDTNEMGVMIDRLHELRKQQGRDHLPFHVRVISPLGFHLNGIKELEDQGVTGVIVGFRNSYQMGQDEQSLQQKIDNINFYAEHVIQKLR